MADIMHIPEMIPAELKKVKLNEREQQFCENIVKGMNGAEALRSAGYVVKEASRYATTMLRKKKIADKISAMRAEAEGYVKVTDGDVLREFMLVVNADIRDFIDEDGLVMSPDHIKRMAGHKTKAIKSIKQTINKGAVTTEVQLYDKLQALQNVARHVGFYKDEEGDKKPVINLVLPGALLNIS